MNNKIEFIKLLLIAVLCNTLIVIGLLLIKISMLFDVIWIESTVASISFFILWHTISYVSQHELKRKLSRVEKGALRLKDAIEAERTWWRSML